MSISIVKDVKVIRMRSLPFGTVGYTIGLTAKPASCADLATARTASFPETKKV